MSCRKYCSRVATVNSAPSDRPRGALQIWSGLEGLDPRDQGQRGLFQSRRRPPRDPVRGSARDRRLVLVPVRERSGRPRQHLREPAVEQPKTSRTWAPYSSGDQTSGCGRSATAGLDRRICTHSSAAMKARSATSAGSTSPAASPHSSQRRVRVQVQSLVSGSGSTPSRYWPRPAGRTDPQLGCPQGLGIVLWRS